MQDWPETDQYGEPCEVWFTTGKNLTSPVTLISPLNFRGDGDLKWADLLLGDDR